ncbi:hypothetical protein AGMMS49975_17030 [Clostridia bacterium]|nr:hypothetical protein AGMMS49975_17030 [Clostridia bacterium]
MATIAGVLKARSLIVNFLEIPATPDPTYNRMQGYTSMTTSKNAKEYSRQYVDEETERTDVTGFSPSIEFGFDRFAGNPTQDYLAEIIDNELTGTAATVNILSADLSLDPSEEDNAFIRPYAVISNSEGDSFDAYTYSGSFASKGPKTWGKATVAADGLTTTWTPTVTP